jgi:hypothetical protein
LKKTITSRESTVIMALFAGAVLVIGISSTSSLAYAQASTFTESARFPIDGYVDAGECAAGGAGEVVHVTGQLHGVFITTLDNAGGFHSKVHYNYQGVSGSGLATGDKYQATGVLQFQANGKVGVEVTWVETFSLIGQGNGNNFLVHLNSHITVNADGTVIAEHDNFRAECK